MTLSRSPVPPRPTPEDLRAAINKPLNDVLAPGLRVVFCGINPGLYSAAVGHSFARPGNRFWPTLHAAGFTGRRLWPWEEEKLLDQGCGLTNIVNRATAAAAELSEEELIEGGRRLTEKIARFRPGFLAFLGLGAYRVAFGRPKATFGPQAEKVGDTALWVLPSPSGLNAFYKPAHLARLYGDLRGVAGLPDARLSFAGDAAGVMSPISRGEQDVK